MRSRLFFDRWPLFEKFFYMEFCPFGAFLFWSMISCASSLSSSLSKPQVRMSISSSAAAELKLSLSLFSDKFLWVFRIPSSRSSINASLSRSAFETPVDTIRNYNNQYVMWYKFVILIYWTLFTFRMLAGSITEALNFVIVSNARKFSAASKNFLSVKYTIRSRRLIVGNRC